MTTDRYQQGLEKMMEFQPASDSDVSSHVKLVDDLKDLAPELPQYIVEFAFGDIYTRSALTKKEQVLVTISSLVALGAEPQIELHINSGLNVGVTKDEIVGAIVHLIPYTGFPRVLNALYIVKRVLAQREADGTAVAPQEQAAG